MGLRRLPPAETVADLVGREPEGWLRVGHPLRRQKVIAWNWDRLWVIGRSRGSWTVEREVPLAGAVEPRALTNEWLDIDGTLYVVSRRDLDAANQLYAAAGGSDTPREQRRALEAREEHGWAECTDVFSAWHSPNPPMVPPYGDGVVAMAGVLVGWARWRPDPRLPRGAVEIAASATEVRVYANGTAAMTAPISSVHDSVDRPGRVSVDGAEVWVTQYDQPVAALVLDRARAARSSPM